jgi:hypothetical protein
MVQKKKMMITNETARPTKLSPAPVASRVKTARQNYPDQVRRIAKTRTAQLAAVLIIALVPSIIFYHQSQVAEQRLNGATSGSPQTTAEVVKRVSRHILLPSGEQPTVATVTDASKVRNQAFFASAASGDKVLVYAQAKKAYLYRPSIDRVIEVAPLAPNTPEPAQPTEQPASP